MTAFFVEGDQQDARSRVQAMRHAPKRAGPNPGVIDCAVCTVGLERFTGRSVDAALASAVAALLLLFPANGLIFLTTTVLGGVERSRLLSSATTLCTAGAVGTGISFAQWPADLGDA